MKQISYSFFTPRQYNDNKFYDKYISRDRYWYNLPAIIIVNKIFYPDFEIRLYISRDIIENPLYDIISESIKRIGGISIEIMDYDYKYTEPTMWRYKPLIESSVDILLCRDIDSVPNEDEILSTLYFINNNQYKINTIRSHKYHNSNDTILLAGLCGFRTKDLNYINKSFDDFYLKKSNPNWGVDQYFLIDFLISKGDSWIKNHFLDSRLSNGYDNKVNKPLLNCFSYENDFYRNQYKLDIDRDLINILNENTTWSGEPVNYRGDILLNILKFEKYEVIRLIKEILYENDILKKFYLD